MDKVAACLEDSHAKAAAFCGVAEKAVGKAAGKAAGRVVENFVWVLFQVLRLYYLLAVGGVAKAIAAEVAVEHRILVYLIILAI